MVDPLEGEPRDLDAGRQIRFAVTPTGVRVAYATVGRGPALVVPAAWVGHLEIAWQDPAMRAFYAPIAACRTVVAYDKPGCGLSDPWPVPQTLDSDLEVLRAVTDHLKLDRVDLLGLSMGVPASLAYAVQNPEAVGRLMLYGGFANGHQIASAEVRTAMVELVRAHWGLGSDVLADIFLPDGTAETKVRFAQLQRRSTSAEVASELLAQCYEIRVDDLLDRVAVPTLVLHRRDDRAIPYRLGRDLAARIPGRGWCRSPAGATGYTSATPRRWSARSWGSLAPPTARCPPNRLRGHPPRSRHGSSRSRPWSPTALPTARSPAGWGSRNARPRGTWSASASGSA